MREPPAVAQRGLKSPPGRAGVSASRPAHPKTPELTFEREDWTLFRSLSILSQKAGVPIHLLPKLPPGAVLMNDLSDALEHRLHRQITEQILREAGIERRVAAALQKIDLPRPEDLHAVVDDALADAPAGCWRAAIAQLADQLLAVRGCAGASPESGA